MNLLSRAFIHSGAQAGTRRASPTGRDLRRLFLPRLGIGLVPGKRLDFARRAAAVVVIGAAPAAGIAGMAGIVRALLSASRGEPPVLDAHGGLLRAHLFIDVAIQPLGLRPVLVALLALLLPVVDVLAVSVAPFRIVHDRTSCS